MMPAAPSADADCIAGSGARKLISSEATLPHETNAGRELGVGKLLNSAQRRGRRFQFWFSHQECFAGPTILHALDARK